MNSNEAETINKTKRWDYLDKMRTDVNTNDNKEVTLLIGGNFGKVLEPR